MKSIYYLSFFLIAFISGLNAQETGGQITFETTSIDYGTVENGSNGERIFTFTNTGSSDLVIENVQSSCGCTIPRKPEAPIPVGEKGEIAVKYDTTRPGPFRKTITVTTNIAGIVALKIKGTVLPPQQ